jgi:hypothetical protein
MHWAEPVAFDFESKITHKKKMPKEPLDTYKGIYTALQLFIQLFLQLY